MWYHIGREHVRCIDVHIFIRDRLYIAHISEIIDANPIGQPDQCWRMFIMRLFELFCLIFLNAAFIPLYAQVTRNSWRPWQFDAVTFDGCTAYSSPGAVSIVRDTVRCMTSPGQWLSIEPTGLSFAFVYAMFVPCWANMSLDMLSVIVDSEPADRQTSMRVIQKVLVLSVDCDDQSSAKEGLPLKAGSGLNCGFVITRFQEARWEGSPSAGVEV